MLKAFEYITHLQMNRHPEGGFFKESFRSADTFAFPNFNGERSYYTSIYFLLFKGEESALHTIQSDEIWCFHDGSPLEIVELDEQGNELITVLGLDLTQGQVPQHCVKAGTVFGARLRYDAAIPYSFVGCQVAPGFDFRDFKLLKEPAIKLEDEEPNTWFRASFGGGYQGPWFSCKISDLGLTVTRNLGDRIAPDGMPNSWTTPYSEIESELIAFKKTLAQLRWEFNYESGALDGTNWSMEFHTPECYWRSTGHEAYPKEYKRILKMINNLQGIVRYQIY